MNDVDKVSTPALARMPKERPHSRPRPKAEHADSRPHSLPRAVQAPKC